MKKFLVISLIFTASFAFSQGCSDAGFCTLDNLKTHQSDSTSYKNNFKVGVNVGGGENDISVFGSYLEYNRNVSSSLDLGVKTNYLSQSLNGFSSSALSDAFVNAGIKLNETTKATIGLKIPFTDGNLKESGSALPMDFQPSLGTFDVIVGVSKKVNDFNFVLAFQQPLTQNKNEYLATIGSPYYSTNNFKRAGDLLFRASYFYAINDKFSISPSILPIYHVANDKYTDALNVEKDINGSSGLTLNGNLFVNYKINTTNSLELSLGSPFVVRDARPDGLTRSFVANLEYKIRF